MNTEEFESIAQEELEKLPEKFVHNLDNVHVVVEDQPSDERWGKNRQGGVLLGLYEGFPLPFRGTGYGTAPVVPDRITLYKKNIEAVARGSVREEIRNVLIHEIAHYYGMTDEEIRRSGF